ncbi:MAG: 50S ribosome-binding GTPase [Candidatus Shikimatogenerans sp. JK-2022]|nr:50S ribosome-binding GTPase [Candidatus Shikimatogenerans bostrichidophilus]
MKIKYYNIISLIGISNVGKSYIFNKFFNKKISFTNKKKQFTRQLIINELYINKKKNLIIDTPGYLFKKKYKLHKYMLDLIFKSIYYSNIIIYITINENKYLFKDKKILNKEIKNYINKKKIFLIIYNKKNKKINNFYIKKFNKNILIIKNNINFNKKLNLVLNNLINKKKNKKIYFIKYNYNNFFYLNELIRYYIYNIYFKEIPYSIYVNINKIIKKKNKYYIYILIYIERISQKKIFIGLKGKNINLLSYLVRQHIKKIYNINLLYLNFTFKILKWKNNNNIIKIFKKNKNI